VIKVRGLEKAYEQLEVVRGVDFDVARGCIFALIGSNGAVYVFGGAIDTGTNSYVTYLLPGILLFTIASGTSYAALRLFVDMQSGIFERFQSMPIARSSLLWAHVLTSLVANVVSLAVVVGVATLMAFGWMPASWPGSPWLAS